MHNFFVLRLLFLQSFFCFELLLCLLLVSFLCLFGGCLLNGLSYEVVRGLNETFVRGKGIAIRLVNLKELVI